MKTSEQINELAAALAKAQGSGDRFAEAESIYQLAREIAPPKRLTGMPVAAQFFAKVAFGLSACWFWRGRRNEHGYGIFSHKMLGETLAHRVSWRLHVGDIAAGQQVLHKCDVRLCVNPDHLFVGSHGENMADMAGKGRSPNRKLSDEDVRAMKSAHAAGGMSMRKLGAMFGVGAPTAWRIINGQRYRGVQ